MTNEQNEKPNLEPIITKLMGLTLVEAQKIYGNIRITRIGEESFMVTRDYSEDRINIELSDEGLDFEEKTTLIGSKEYKNKIYKNKGDAKIVKAYIG